MPEVDRSSLLQRILAVEPGCTPREDMHQSACVVLRKGYAFTLSREVACACPTGLPPDVAGAVEAKTLIQILRNRTEAKLDVAVDKGALRFSGRLCGVSKLPLDPDIVLRIDAVERPDAWRPCPKDFADGISFAAKCTKTRDDKSVAKTCVHITPAWVEASDNVKFARRTSPTFVTTPVLLRGKTATVIRPMGFTLCAQTTKWLHFKNPTGLRMSLRTLEPDDYPDLSQLLTVEGRRITLPQGLKGAAKRAGLVADVTEEGKTVYVRIDSNGVTVAGGSVTGEHVEVRNHKYDGPPVAFEMPAAVLEDLSERTGEITITDVCMRLADGPSVFVTSLKKVEP